jgi:hypothetical protein
MEEIAKQPKKKKKKESTVFMDIFIRIYGNISMGETRKMISSSVSGEH